MDNAIPVIGKDVIESLTLGMYEDSRFIYREYIQNSADQIDKAVEQGLMDKNEEEIHITIDDKKRRIEIYDNATGIDEQNIVSILQNIAKSTKERGKDKGFRGIGRLGGLGYCEKLIFETSFKGEPTKSIMIWDAHLLKEIINNRHTKENAVEVIQKVTRLIKEKEDSIKHYFKVILEGVTNDMLLDKKSVEDYLIMVAPIGYPTGFIFRQKIYDFVKQNNFEIDEYKIYLNRDLLHKGYTTTIYTGNNGNKKRVDDVFDLRFFIGQIKSDILFWGWYGVSDFVGVIDGDANIAAGIRLRKNNIQLGDKSTLLKLHRNTQRGNYYFIGEVHALHPDLIPNSRRDYFGENSKCHEFEKNLREFFCTELHDLYYAASKIRSANRDVQALVEFEKTVSEKEERGFNNKEDRQKLYEEFENKKKKAEEAKKKLENIKSKTTESDTPVAKIFKRVVTTEGVNPTQIAVEPQKEKGSFVTDRYTWLPKSERKTLSKIFSVIENVLSKDLAKNLIDKIDEELRK
ncbi:Chaperone protein HtpG [termite gut metagenome]|uniref:Chaperone protein HtpG n=1 Tax=termite gut metagenome TaxID=433724 RepID=A0A5J4QSW9_9ZZZZ